MTAGAVMMIHQHMRNLNDDDDDFDDLFDDDDDLFDDEEETWEDGINKGDANPTTTLGCIVVLFILTFIFTFLFFFYLGHS